MSKGVSALHSNPGNYLKAYFTPGTSRFFALNHIVASCAGSAFDWRKVADHSNGQHRLNSILGSAHYLSSACALSPIWTAAVQEAPFAEAVADICLGVTQQVWKKAQVCV